MREKLHEHEDLPRVVPLAGGMRERQGPGVVLAHASPAVLDLGQTRAEGA